MLKLLVCLLSIFMLPAFAAPSEMITSSKPPSPYTVTREHSSITDAPLQMIFQKRKTDYPTQIVSMTAELHGSGLNCDQVLQKIDNFYSSHITYDMFFYNTINYCSCDPKTNFATKFTINSYFDPLNDEAIAYLERYLAEHNGHDLLGSPFLVENAQGLVVSLTVSAGWEDKLKPNTLLLLREDTESHYFASNYDMRLQLRKDIVHRFYSNNPALVLPFMNKWLLAPPRIYERILENSNYTELRPELVFLMNNKQKIFTPLLRLYFANHCEKYENKHCL